MPMSARDRAETERALEMLAKELADSIRFHARQKLEMKQLSLQSLTKVKDFMSLPAEKRKALLLDPSFRSSMIQAIDPETFGAGGKKAKQALADTEGMRQRDLSVMALGGETADERLKREKEAADAAKARSEQILAEQKMRLSTGVEAPTPMSLLIAGDVKDPIANALFSLIPQDELKIIAEGEKKTGPLYQRDQMQEWYKFGMNEGLPPGVAMETAFRISRGDWDKVPLTYTDATTGKVVPVRGKAEQQLAMDAMNARSRMQEVQNTMQNSIATSAAQLAEKAGIPLDQARANIIALRQGQKAPYPTPNLEAIVGLDMANKRLEVEKNIQNVLNDKTGIGVIRESLNSMLAAYKEESGMVFNSAAAKDLQQKVVGLQEELAKRLGERYGVKLPEYGPTWGDTIKGAMSTTWKALKATGAYGEDVSKAIEDSLQQPVEGSRLPVPPSGRVGPNVGAPQIKHTPEQEQTLTSFYTAAQKSLADPNATPETKNAIRKYIQDVLEPAYNDPSKFDLLFQPFKPED